MAGPMAGLTAGLTAGRTAGLTARLTARSLVTRWALPGALVLALSGVGVAEVAVAQRTPAVAVPPVAAGTLPLALKAPTTVCPGPETLLVPDGGTPAPPTGPVVVGELTGATAGPKVGLATVTPTSAGPVLLARGAPATPGAPASPGAAAAAATVSAVSAVSAVQVTLGRSGDLRGLAATTCAEPAGSVWLVGGGTGQGRRARLLLANPTAVPAVVDVVPHGPAGPVAATGGQALVVPPGREIAVFVDAIAPGIEQLAVQVVARSGRVVAVLHDTLVRGTVSGGVDDVTVAAPPATEQVVPGLALAAPGVASVRIAVPGPVEGVIKVRLLGPDGALDLPSAVATIPAGGVADVPLTGLPDGTYTAVVDADVPVVAAGLVTTTVPGGELAGTPDAVGRQVPPSELAWVASASALRGAVGIVVPALPSVSGIAPVRATLVLASPGPARVTVRQVGPDGVPGAGQDVALPGGTTSVIALDAGTAAVLVTPPGAPGTGGPAYASLLLQTSDRSGPMLSTVPLRPGPSARPAAPAVVADPALGLG